jgi:hypothetical protein
MDCVLLKHLRTELVRGVVMIMQTVILTIINTGEQEVTTILHVETMVGTVAVQTVITIVMVGRTLEVDEDEVMVEVDEDEVIPAVEEEFKVLTLAPFMAAIYGENVF